MTHLSKSALYHPIGTLWGHIGLSLPGHPKTRWYPIAEDQRLSVLSQLSKIQYGTWIRFSTLNSRGVAADLSSINNIKFLIDDADFLEDDWDLSWDSSLGFTSLFYQAVESTFVEGFQKLPKDFEDEISTAVTEHGLTSKKWYADVHTTHLVYKNGSIDKLELTVESLTGLHTRVFITPSETSFLKLEFNHPESMQMQLSPSNIQMVDLPLYLLEFNGFLQ